MTCPEKTAQLIFNNLMTLDDRLRVTPDLAERLENPDPLTYVVTLKHGVTFHDGHELTSADVVYTFRSLLDPAFVSPRKGAFRMVRSVDARDRYTVVFTLREPFGSFPVNLVIPIVPDGAGPAFRDHPVGTGPYKFVSYATDDRLELARFDQYFGGRPRNEGVILRIVPDDIMRGLELRKGTMDVVVNDLAPDIVYQLGQDPNLQLVEAPGVDYQYIGVNMRDPILQNTLVRQAIAHAIDRDAIITHLRRGLAIHATGILPPVSWAFAPSVPEMNYDPSRARELLDEAGYHDTDGDGPEPRLHLSLKMSNVEFNRLQASVIQENLRAVGIALDVRTYEFATLYADVLERELSAVFSPMGGRRGRGPRHPEAGVSLHTGAAVRLQSGVLQERPCGLFPRSGSRRHRRRTAQAVLRRGSGHRRRSTAVHQPVVQDERRGGPTIARRVPHSSDSGFHVP